MPLSRSGHLNSLVSRALRYVGIAGKAWPVSVAVQAKRTNVGIALITSPRVLFLDEPTSGFQRLNTDCLLLRLYQMTCDAIDLCITDMQSISTSNTSEG